MSRVSVKALRHYHDVGLLRPDFVDPESGYRYYTQEQFYDLRVILELKKLGFSLKDIREILDRCEEDGDLVEELEVQRKQLNARIRSYRDAVENIEMILKNEAKITMSADIQFDRVEEKQIPEMLVAGHRMQGRYDEVGKGFKLLFRHAGRRACGPAMTLFHDGEYKDHADFEPCIPVKRVVEAEGVSSRILRGGQAFTIIHQGPYDSLSDSYKIVMDAMKAKGVKARVPSREIYLKGPGMILKGNPKNYLTEIQFLIEE